MNYPNLKTISPLLLTISLILTTTGCSTIIPAEKITPESVQVDQYFDKSVHVKIDMRETEQGTFKNFTGDGFAHAMISSINQSKLFNKATKTGPADYILSGDLSVEFQSWGADLENRVFGDWRLVRASDSTEIWSEVLSSSYKAGLLEAFSAHDRSGKSTMQAAKNHIQTVLKKVSQLKL